ncbi:hypothetical protein BCR44DRAFT_1139337 [Catenaria anguillulae PL171]|uniref:Uncharacterized protein n=1 Tax=Catenaria anguillulae PL171 TaxID=765915 RepID=A0A1Y2HLY7_9FUNG|nr:hypothetical protein BCR44DRAFT_1139337 [Catenaria anguillulae PL171]
MSHIHSSAKYLAIQKAIAEARTTPVYVPHAKHRNDAKVQQLIKDMEPFRRSGTIFDSFFDKAYNANVFTLKPYLAHTTLFAPAPSLPRALDLTQVATNPPEAFRQPNCVCEPKQLCLLHAPLKCLASFRTANNKHMTVAILRTYQMPPLACVTLWIWLLGQNASPPSTTRAGRTGQLCIWVMRQRAAHGDPRVRAKVFRAAKGWLCPFGVGGNFPPLWR